MDREWIRKQREELERLFDKKTSDSTLKFGISLLSDQKIGSAMDIGFASLDRVPEDKKALLEKIKALEEENKELKHKLVMKTLAYK